MLSRKKGSTTVKMEETRKTAEAGAESQVVIPEKGSGSRKKGVEAWRKMTPQGRRERRRTRPEVIIIFKRGEELYANIVRRVKADPELTNLRGNIKQIKQSHQKNLMYVGAQEI